MIALDEEKHQTLLNAARLISEQGTSPEWFVVGPDDLDRAVALANEPESGIRIYDYSGKQIAGEPIEAR